MLQAFYASPFLDRLALIIGSEIKKYVDIFLFLITCLFIVYLFCKERIFIGHQPREGPRLLY